jgi:hypothetical protein
MITSETKREQQRLDVMNINICLNYTRLRIYKTASKDLNKSLPVYSSSQIVRL